MRIVHVNYYAGQGGAGIASYNLHQALLNSGCDSHFYAVASALKAGKNLHLASAKVRLKCQFFQRLEHQLLKLDGYHSLLPRSLNCFSSGAVAEILALKPDIIHLHWCHGNLLALEEFAQFPVPTVITLHDSWLISGAEHHPAPGDERYISGYQSGHDFWNRRTFKRKQQLWSNWFPQCIAPSQWLAKNFRASYWGKSRQIQQIYNVIDTTIFRPGKSTLARRKWGIAPESQVLIFGAMSIGDANKGGNELLKMLQILKQRGITNLQLLLLGQNVNLAPLPFPAILTGYQTKPEDMAAIYQAGDALVLASKMDNLPNMLLEAAACGCATCGFPVGGIPEILTACQNGFAASNTTPEALADAVQKALTAPHSGTSNLANCFEPEQTVPQHLKLYQQLM